MELAISRLAIHNEIEESAQHSVHPTGGILRVFGQFAWLEVGSVKVALSRPTHQRVTQTVGRFLAKDYRLFSRDLSRAVELEFGSQKDR